MATQEASSLTQKTHALECLQMRILLASRLATLEICVRECSALQDALSRFAGEYFSAVGEEARTLCSLLAPREHAAITQAHAEMDDGIAVQKKARASQMKQRYRKLAQAFHPDVRGDDAGAAQMMQAVNAAYARRDMAGLMRMEIEHIIGSQHASKSAEALAEKLAQCEQLIGEATAERETLEKSPLFVLHERTLLARLAGKDFIGNVLRGIQAQIKLKQARQA